jgi:ubiquinone/menaquinone biosynthesis C-methylase UbiE
MQRVLSPFMLGETAASAHRKVTAKIPLAPGSRLLEVSPGPGTFHRFLRERLGSEGRLVSLDLSFQMLLQCRKRGDPAAILVHGNGQHLPFRDGAFDGLFHFGGVNLFNDPNRALTEFVRVVRPGGTVSWGDEGFLSDYPDGLKKRMLTRMNPGYLKPRPPVPAGLRDVTTEAVYGGTAYLVVGRKR